MCRDSQTFPSRAGDAQRVRFDFPNWLTLVVEARSAADAESVRRQVAAGRLRLLVGDESEFEAFDPAQPYANLLQFEIDIERRQLTVGGSLVGLPPVFLWRSAQAVTLTSPFPPQHSFDVAHGAVDLEAAADILRWGHPIDGRTLAGDLRLAPANSLVTLGERPEFIVTPLAAPARTASNASVEDLIKQQIDAFMASAERLQTAAACVSLSGGLDSRATAIGLLRLGRKVPCVTLAAQPDALDARLARALCDAYGTEHIVVTTGDTFRRGLADRVVRASQLTMGVAALQQSIDLYLYEQLGGRFTRRVSGNLGNQVGRGGVESLTVAQPAPEMLSAEGTRVLATRAKQPWFIDRMNSAGFGKVLFEQEVNFWSTANYVAGSQYAVQQMVYADRRLLALACELYARLPELQSIDRETLRRRDLRHRFAGAPIQHSFQRRFMAEHDQPGRNIAINWGWLARGGWSPSWLLEASRTALDLGLNVIAGKSGALRPVTRLVPRSLRRPFALVSWPTLLRNDLRDLTYDATGSQAARDSGLFDAAGLRTVLDDHFSGRRDQHKSVAAALELSLGAMSLRK